MTSFLGTVRRTTGPYSQYEQGLPVDNHTVERGCVAVMWLLTRSFPWRQIVQRASATAVLAGLLQAETR